jgi:hypothetical protein
LSGLANPLPETPRQVRAKFDHWVAKRNALQKAGPQEPADRAQKWVSKYFDKMHERGYFRDSYNPSPCCGCLT